MKNGNGTAVAVKTGGSVVPFDASAFKAGQANIAKVARSNRVSFLRMDKSGDWYYGTDDTEASGKIAYVLPLGGVHGWQCWADTDLDGVAPELLGSEMTAVKFPMPECPEAVPKNGREWVQTLGISMVIDGEPITYTSNSLGGKTAIGDLGTAQTEQYAEVGDDGPMVAKVELASDWYKHKKYGKTYYPIFKVLGWVDQPPVGAEAAKPAPAKKAPAKAPPPPAKKAPAKARRAS
jgi:hypothetical protein